jgi:hypothetical protein
VRSVSAPTDGREAVREARLDSDLIRGLAWAAAAGIFTVEEYTDVGEREL